MKKLIHSVMLVVLLLQSFLPAVDVFAREAGGNLFARTEMAAPQETVPPAADEDQELPTATLTAEITATPTETAPASETPSETPTLSATPSETPLPATATATATPEPTQVEETEPAVDLPYEIILKSDPEFITPGGRFNLHWQITALLPYIWDQET